MLRVSTLMQYTAGEQAISARQRDLLNAQLRVSSGKRIASPADDPIGSATGTELRARLSQLDQFGRNQSHARFLLNQSEAAITQFTDALMEAKEKVLGGLNATFSDEQRRIFARDLSGVLSRLVGVANAGDGVGGYLFAGGKEGAVPFSQSGTTVSFSGDELVQRLEVSNGRFLQTKFTGDDVFLKMRPGNGSFTTAASSGNIGAARIDAGGVTDPSLVTGSGYTIDFDGTQFVVTRASDATTFNIPASSTGTTTLAFDGLKMAVSGIPATGDQFTVAPAAYRSIFDTLAQAIAALESPAPNPALRAQADTVLNGAGASIDQALDHLLLKRAEIGASLAEIEGFEKWNDDRNLEYEGRLSAIEDVDYAQAITDLQKKQATFEAAIKSYSTVSKLSLFDYL